MPVILSKGVYPNRGTDSTLPLTSQVLTKTNVDGASAGYTWRALTPTSTSFDWHLVTDHISQIRNIPGKKLAIRIQTNGYQTDGAAPLWLDTFGIPKLTGATDKIYVPWNATYNTQVRAFLNALNSEVINPNKDVIAYVVLDPFQKADSNEMPSPTLTTLPNWRDDHGWSETIHKDQLISNIDYLASIIDSTLQMGLTYRVIAATKSRFPMLTAFVHAHKQYGARFMPRDTAADEGPLGIQIQFAFYANELSDNLDYLRVCAARTFSSLMGWAAQFGAAGISDWRKAIENTCKGATGTFNLNPIGVTHIEPPWSIVDAGTNDADFTEFTPLLDGHGP